MWLLNFLPDWIFHAVLLAGVLGLIASLVLSFIPFFNTYKLPVQVGSILLMVVGVWFEGAMSNQAAWEAKVKEVEAKIAVSEEKSKTENVKLVTKVVTKTEYYKERGADIVQYVDREITKYDNTCPVPNEVVKAHNDAAVPGDKK